MEMEGHLAGLEEQIEDDDMKLADGSYQIKELDA